MQKKFQLLKNEELVSFQDAYEARTGGRPPLEYLERSQVWGSFARGHMISGFVVGTVPPWRYMGWLPEDERGGFEFLLESDSGADVISWAEIALVWITREAGEYERMRLWLTVVREARRYDRLLVGTVVPALERVYRGVFGRPFHEYVGEVTVDGHAKPGAVMVVGRPSRSAVAGEWIRRQRRRPSSSA